MKKAIKHNERLDQPEHGLQELAPEFNDFYTLRT